MQHELTIVKDFGVYDLCRILPIGEEQIRKYLLSKRLKGTKKRGRWRVSKEDLIKFIKDYGFSNNVNLGAI